MQLQNWNLLVLQLTDEEQYAVGVRVVCAMYVRMRRHKDIDKNFYTRSMRNTILVAEWLLPESISANIPRNGELSPDVCSSCHNIFGETVGGRLRESCHICQSTRDSISGYELQELCRHLRMSWHQIELHLIHAILGEVAYGNPSSPKTT